MYCEGCYLDFYPAKKDKDIYELEEIKTSSVDIRLKYALSRVSERDRSILQYRAEGFSYENISEFLNIKTVTAKTAYCRALKKVRETYNKSADREAEETA